MASSAALDLGEVRSEWSDEEFILPETPIDPMDALLQAKRREEQLDRDLSALRDCVAALVEALRLLGAARERQAARSLQLQVTGMRYPDPGAPEAVWDLHRANPDAKPAKVTDTKGKDLIRAELNIGALEALVEMWEHKVRMVQSHIQGRKAQLSGHQTEMNTTEVATALATDWHGRVNHR